jgi:hypothetical protein
MGPVPNCFGCYSNGKRIGALSLIVVPNCQLSIFLFAAPPVRRAVCLWERLNRFRQGPASSCCYSDEKRIGALSLISPNSVGCV